VKREMFWVREKKVGKKWVPDVEEAMCLTGTKQDAMELLDGYGLCEGKYRARVYVPLRKGAK